MENDESFREVSELRLRLQMNKRLRLESLAAISRVFREHGEWIEDDLLASMVFALPGELISANRPQGADTQSQTVVPTE